MAYLFIFLSAFCSLLIAHFLKVTEVKQLRTLNTLTANYLVAALFALVWGTLKAGFGFLNTDLLFFGFCLVVGIFFIANFIAYSKSVHTNGVGVTITAMRLSLLVPVLLSVILYSEYLTFLKTIGVILVFASLILLKPKKTEVKVGTINAGWLLLIVFALSGFADASLKVYEEEFSTELNELIFMGLVFLGAFFIGFISSIYRKGQLFTREEFKLGTLIGLPNLYSSIFLIYALADISGSIAYPMVNMLSVAGGTALGLLRWNDSVSTMQWIGLSIALVAILILL
ncbi:hypothetical protein G3570_07340 [Balneolaceae bacterium YR4-1]|uniref:EamA-like transporter family protein n=1 Tax=Halalkalibaculum roseum TaxID=2709311 RepID=A0A6M1SU34_9BACT|nr:hypothetical protein [Halalkalibaculum roseum]NGP76440.1 hypothetical protein [Halalkalibaculum roseum]